MMTPRTPKTIRTIGRLAWFATLGRRDCPPGWKLTRSGSSGAPDPEIEKHLAACATCAARSARHDALVAEARNLSAPVAMSEQSRAEHRRASAGRAAAAGDPDEGAAPAVARDDGGRGERRGGDDRRRDRRARRSLIMLPPPRRRRRSPLHPRHPRHRGHRSAPSETPASPVCSLLPTRSSDLDDGRIELDVVPLARGERFRVATDNGEVEVRGTSFEVLAADRQLRAVSVSRGRVEVRSGGGGLSRSWMRATGGKRAGRAARDAGGARASPGTQRTGRGRRGHRGRRPQGDRRPTSGRRRASDRRRSRAPCSIPDGPPCAPETRATPPRRSASSSAARGAAPSRKMPSTGARSRPRAARRRSRRGVCSGSSWRISALGATGRSGGRARLDPVRCRRDRRSPPRVPASGVRSGGGRARQRGRRSAPNDAPPDLCREGNPSRGHQASNDACFGARLGRRYCLA